MLFSRPQASSVLPTISRIVDNLVYEQRFAEVIELVVPYLPLINHAARRKLFSQKLHDKIKLMKGSELTLALHNFLNKDALERESRRSAFSKKLRRWIGNLAVMVPAKHQAETAAKDIARTLFQSTDFRHYIISTRPYFAISLFRLEVHAVQDFSEAYFTGLISDTSSILYQELEQNQNTSFQGGYNYPENNRLLHFLFTDARTAENLEVWRPIGEHLLNLLRSNESPDFVASLNRREEGFDKERWNNPVWAGIFFFDLMVTAAAYQAVRWHMWLYYFPLFVERLEKLYDASDPEVNKSDEFPTRSAHLIYEAVSTLCGWVRLVSKLPANSPHRRSEIFSAAQNREWDSWWRDNDNIPVSAAIALGSCMQTIATSERLDDKFAGYIYEVVVSTIRSLARDGNVGHLRSFLIQSIVNGGQSQFNHNYGLRLATLRDKVDYVIWEHVDDYQVALEQAYPNQYP